MTFVKQETSLITIYHLIREFSSQNILGTKAAMAFVVFTLNSILVFPTIASAMTGYSASTEAFVQNSNGENYIKYSTFSLVEYVIQDGDRIGLTKDYIMSYRAPETLGKPHFMLVLIKIDGLTHRDSPKGGPLISQYDHMPFWDLHNLQGDKFQLQVKAWKCKSSLIFSSVNSVMARTFDTHSGENRCTPIRLSRSLQQQQQMGRL